MKVARTVVLALFITGTTTAYGQHRGGFGGGGFGGGFGGYRGGNGGGGYGGGGFGGNRGGYGTGGGGGGFQGRGMGMDRPTTAAMARPGGGVGQMGHPYFGNRPMYHGGWYRGDWRGAWGGPYGYRPWGWGWYGGWGWGPGFGWGLGWGLGWGIGASIGMASPWNWGYFGYYNPYWMGPVGGVTYVNYSQPVVVPPTPASAPANYPSPAPAPNVPQTPAQNQGLMIFTNAQALFRQGQYQAALNETNRAVAILPNDSLMHEFRALCLFATGDYQQAAAAVHAVVSVGPGWNWATVSNLYGNPNSYTEQLRALEAYCNEHPASAAPRFLLAYHYLLAEHNQQAATVLQDVARLEPDDQLASQLLKGLTTPADAAPAKPAAPARPVDRGSILGHWKANRADGSSFDLELSGDNRFTWKFKQQERQQQFSGNFTLANNYLILSASDQNALIGQVSMETSDKLNFRLAGGNPAEPGLTFTR